MHKQQHADVTVRKLSLCGCSSLNIIMSASTSKPLAYGEYKNVIHV